MNIVDVIKSNLSGSALSQLGSLIGATPEQTEKATSAAVPTILAGLSKQASSKDGADRLTEILNNLDPSLTGNPGGMYTGNTAGKAQEQGSSMLDKLLGGGLLGSLGGLIGKFSGVGGGVIQKLLAYLAPLVLGMITKQLGGKATPSGLSQFFSEQQKNISSAMPAGFSLGSIPGLGDVGASVQKATDSMKKGANNLTWLIPLLLIALAVLAYLYFKPENKVNLPASTDAVKQVTKTLEAGLTEDVNSFFSSATESLNGIKDAATADAALPKLKLLDEQATGFKKAFNLVPEAGRGAIKTLISAGIEKLKAVVAKVIAMPGVGEKLKPVVDALMAKLAAVTG